MKIWVWYEWRGTIDSLSIILVCGGLVTVWCTSKSRVSANIQSISTYRGCLIYIYITSRKSEFSTFTVRPIYSWDVRLCCSSVNTLAHPWRSSGSCSGESFLITVLLNRVLQPRSHGLFPYLGVGKRPWERGCVLFNFYSTFVSFCVIVVICLAFCFPFQYFNVTSTLKSPVGTSQLSGYVSDYVRRYLGSGIRSLGSWNRVMESGLRGKIRDRYHEDLKFWLRGLKFETSSALESLFGGQFKLSTQLIKPSYCI